MAEYRTNITVDSGPAATEKARAALASAGSMAPPPNREHLAALKRNAAAEAKSGQFAGGVAALPDHPLAAPPEAPEPRENLDSVLIEIAETPDHARMEVLVGPPAGVSLTIRVLNYYGGREAIPADEMVTRALMSVRQVNGQTWPQINNAVDRDRLGHTLGDDGISLVIATCRKYWPPLRIAELPVLKKNPR